MIIIARILRLLFKIPFTRKYYFGLYKKIIKPYHLFRGLSTVCRYDGNLRMKVDLDEWIQQNVFFFGIFDASGIAFIKSVLREGDVFIDIGANVGCYTLVASAITGITGKVIAFEPVGGVADRLQFNIGLNAFQNVTVVRKAVYREEAVLTFYLSGQENLGMSSIFRHDTESGVSVEIPATDLDSYHGILDLGAIRLVKIDIEGAELLALEGMKKTIGRFRPIILVEVSPQVVNEASERQKVFDLFSAMDYRCMVLNNAGEPGEVPPGKRDSYTNFVFLP